MLKIIFVKAVILSFIWMFGWTMYFARIAADFNATNLMIVFAPVLMVVAYFFLFWWG